MRFLAQREAPDQQRPRRRLYYRWAKRIAGLVQDKLGKDFDKVKEDVIKHWTTEGFEAGRSTDCPQDSIYKDPAEFKPLASAEVLTAAETGDDRMSRRFGTQNWAPIALTDGKLLIRDQSRMLCVRVAE